MIWGTRGDWYGVDFAIGDDPVMRYDKVKVTVPRGESLEATVIQAVANRANLRVSEIKVSHIIRMDS